MILVLEERYESPLSIDTKKVPLALRLTSQWRFNDVRVTKNWILRILDENRSNFNISPKILGICDFDKIKHFSELFFFSDMQADVCSTASGTARNSVIFIPVLAGRKIILKGVVTTPLSVDEGYFCKVI